MARPSIDWTYAQDATLYFLYSIFIDEEKIGGPFREIHEISESLPFIPQNIVRATLDHLITQELVGRQEVRKIYPFDAARDRNTASEYGITRLGVQLVSDWPDSYFYAVEAATLGGEENLPNTRTIDTPASDRFVSVKDNQSSFDELTAALSKIKDEFAADHNKHELPIDNLEARKAEIDAFELMVGRGWVSPKSAENLLASLRYIKEVCVEFKEVCIAVGVGIAALTKIFGFL